jgi:hypothetical protein
MMRTRHDRQLMRFILFVALCMVDCYSIGSRWLKATTKPHTEVGHRVRLFSLLALHFNLTAVGAPLVAVIHD